MDGACEWSLWQTFPVQQSHPPGAEWNRFPERRLTATITFFVRAYVQPNSMSQESTPETVPGLDSTIVLNTLHMEIPLLQKTCSQEVVHSSRIRCMEWCSKSGHAEARKISQNYKLDRNTYTCHQITVGLCTCAVCHGFHENGNCTWPRSGLRHLPCATSFTGMRTLFLQRLQRALPNCGMLQFLYY